MMCNWIVLIDLIQRFDMEKYLISILWVSFVWQELVRGRGQNESELVRMGHLIFASRPVLLTVK